MGLLIYLLPAVTLINDFVRLHVPFAVKARFDGAELRFWGF